MAPRRPPTSEELAHEARRQVEVNAMRHGPVQDIQRLLFQAKAGSWLQPHVILGALVAVVGAAIAGCSGLLALIAAQQ
jgi:hypothetical protein